CSVMLSIILSTSCLLPVESFGAPSFKDIRGHWAEQYIEKSVAQGIIKGYVDGRFLPDEKVTRAEFVSMLNRALGNTSTSSIKFNDVGRDAWFYNDVTKSVTSGFVSGFGDGTFKPNSKITRQEAAVMLARIIPSYGYSSNLKKFTDYPKISDWAYESMSKVSGKGYISGYTDGKVHPLDSLTRAQAAKIISDIIVNEKIIKSDPIVKKDGTKLSGSIYSNNVTMHKDLGNGSANIDNCVILGKLIIQGGGDGTIAVNNSRVTDATVNRASGSVKVHAKGETAMVNTVCAGTFALNTSALSGGDFGPGFERISFSSSAKGTLQGNFKNVSLDGTSTELRLVSGNINTLDVNTSAKKSEIIIEDKATVTKANVYSESYFWGAGTINDMHVHAKGVTYETKPKKWTIYSNGSTPTKSDPRLSVTFSPSTGKTNVYQDTKITITFNSAMKNRDGSTITNGDISDIVTIRKGSSTGSTVAYSGSINSAKTVITLTPTKLLESKTKYYIVIKDGTMRDQHGERNDEEISYFTTGNTTEKLVVTYSPANGDTKVPVDRRSFTISFSEGVTKSNGKALDSDYLIDSVITFQKGSSSISKKDYAVSINSKKDLITVTLGKDYDLTLNTKYTLGIRSSSLKTAGGTTVSSSSVSWTTVGTPALSGIGVTPGESHVDFKATPNVNGTIYTVLLAEKAAAPSATQIRNGKDGSGNDALASSSAKVTASNAVTVKLSSDSNKIERDTPYKVYSVLTDGAGNNSSVVISSVRTEILKLKGLKVISDDGTDRLSGFKPDVADYNVIVPNDTTTVEIAAEVGTSFAGSLTIKGKEKATSTLS
ncbi:MAG TPA: S-layer homology domain-containing protein, partial [Anaerovoracaceae bacterium]|nr:S-layer homology domain-containing protein [Anaerovoracaceae bacterium]